jgi:hypothetical protein
MVTCYGGRVEECCLGGGRKIGCDQDVVEFHIEVKNLIIEIFGG